MARAFLEEVETVSSSSEERQRLGAHILERLRAGRPLTEIADEEGVSPGLARELVADAVAARGFDP